MSEESQKTVGPFGPMAAVLAPLRARIPRQIVEREVLRVVATMADDSVDIFTSAQQDILKWVTKRTGQALPPAAWTGQAFELLAAGRPAFGVSLSYDGGRLWSIKADDPDKQVPGRVWSTEITLGQRSDEAAKIGLRLLVNSNEEHLNIVPSVPGLIRQITENSGLYDAGIYIDCVPKLVETSDDAATLIDWLTSPTRRLPIIVATGDERSDDPDSALIDAATLANGICGLAHVALIPSRFTYLLTNAFGKSLSTFHGAVRIYNPGFDELSEASDHRLYLSNSINGNSTRIETEIRLAVARSSLRRFRLGQDIVPFASIRSHALRFEQQQQAASGAPESAQLEAANRSNEALEAENRQLHDQAEQALDLAQAEEERAEAAEQQLSAAWARIGALESALKSRGEDCDTQVADPEDWDLFAAWCEENFSGRLVLAPSARRGLRKPEFEDIAAAASGIRWLASEARERFLQGGGKIANIVIDGGLSNAPCGSDEYDFSFQGRRLKAEWHVKSGGNTRQPERCLRIYYAFDPSSGMIVVSDMPAHRKTGAS